MMLSERERGMIDAYSSDGKSERQIANLMKKFKTAVHNNISNPK